MKRIFNHPKRTNNHVTTWKSSGQLEDSKEFRDWVNREFPQGVAELKDSDDQELSRRSFMKFMGASTALAGFGINACRKPASYLIPFTDNVEWAVPGKPLFYTSVARIGSTVTPVLVKTVDGRPIHLTGNKQHPESGSGLSTIGLAEITQLYDPDRSSQYLRNGEAVDKTAFDDWFKRFLEQHSSGESVGFLIGEQSSPTENRLLSRIAAKLPQARFYRYEAVNNQGSFEATSAFLGKQLSPVPDFKKTTRVLALDSDFLHMQSPSLLSSQDFHEAHKPEDAEGNERTADEMARLYVAESEFSLTGGMADHRIRLSHAGILRFALELAKQVAAEMDNSELMQLVDTISGDQKFDRNEKAYQKEWLRECALDLCRAKGKAVVLAGSQHGSALHMLAIALNEALEAPLSYVDCSSPVKSGGIEDLYDDVNKGLIGSVISITPANPVYDAPKSVRSFAETLSEKSVDLIHLGLHADETARAADWHIPAAHWLESWNDGKTTFGRYSVAQPFIDPLNDGEGVLSFLSRFLNAEDVDVLADDHVRSLVFATFREVLGMDESADASHGEAALVAWEECLRHGYFGDADSTEDVTYSFNKDLFQRAWSENNRPLPELGANGQGLEIRFAADSSLYDGRYANNGWMQEAPDPVTKLTWDNAVLMSPETAYKLGKELDWPELAKSLGANRALIPTSEDQYLPVADNDQVHADESPDREAPMVKLRVNDSVVEMPVLLAFGHAEDSITVHMGYGRENAGRVADGLDGEGVGFDINGLRITSMPYVGTVQEIEKTDKTYPFALTGEHHTMFGRGMVVESPLTTGDDHHGRGYTEPGYSSKAWIDAHAPDSPSIYRPEDWSGESLINDPLHQWAMTIDLTSCTGCNACLVACQSENNIPIVGKNQVRMGREMHWIRMDRYFSQRTQPRGSSASGSGADISNEERDLGNPEMLVQPVACQQCEYAPCETVCPVNATVHSEDGLNLMAYNRCIGTRYCANNCPYKARRFNFFDYNKRPLDELYKGPLAEPNGLGTTSLKAQKNPDVTVRMRGVMEKCTYCIQRIQSAKIDAKSILPRKSTNSGLPSEEIEISHQELRIETNSVRVACQDACPSDSIIFGNLLDENDTIRKYKKLEQKGQTRQVVPTHKRSYDLLDYVGARPRTSYLARVRNLNHNIAESLYRGDASVDIG